MMQVASEPDSGSHPHHIPRTQDLLLLLAFGGQALWGLSHSALPRPGTASPLAEWGPPHL